MDPMWGRVLVNIKYWFCTYYHAENILREKNLHLILQPADSFPIAGISRLRYLDFGEYFADLILLPSFRISFGKEFLHSMAGFIESFIENDTHNFQAHPYAYAG